MSDARPDRHALLELDAQLSEIAMLRDEGDAARFDREARYRWVLHRLWIAAGNEALAYTAATGQPVRADRTWSNLYDLRNHLAHSRLPTSTRDSSGGSPGPAWTRCKNRSGTSCARLDSTVPAVCQAHGRKRSYRPVNRVPASGRSPYPRAATAARA